jgi:membrane protease YdiL (CAAX protease family)
VIPEPTDPSEASSELGTEGTIAANCPPLPPQIPFWGYFDVALFIAFGIPALLVGFGVTFGVQWLFELPGRTAPLLLGQFLTYGIWFFGLFGILKLRYDQPFWRSLAWQGSSRAIFICAAAGVAVAVTVGLIAVLAGASDGRDLPMRDMLTDKLSVTLVGLLAISVGPLAEELAFRGFLMPLLARSMGDSPAILLTAAAFASLHGPQYGWSVPNLIPIGIAGVAFGVARVVTGSTAAATAMHCVYNATAFGAFLAQGGADNLPW